ncbi:MAG: TfoX/Sxy family protein [Coriobacteriia bacterium]
MAYSTDLDSRVGEIATAWGAQRRAMFGGTCYLLNGNMMGGVHENRLILRVGPSYEGLLAEPGVVPFDITGRPMRGWVMVEPERYEAEGVESWLCRAREYTETLPPK